MRATVARALSWGGCVATLPLIFQLAEDRDETVRKRALDSLAREDPTFRWRTDPETGQILVSGMGELHLQIMSIRVQRVSSAHSSREVQASTWTIPLSRK